jgi:hypothetical protein
MNLGSGFRRLTFVIWLAVALLGALYIALNAELYKPFESVCPSGLRPEYRCHERYTLQSYRDGLVALTVFEAGWAALLSSVYFGVRWVVSGFQQRS